MYDLVIIGAGPAGLTAAVYAARKKMNFVLLSKSIGGQAIWSGNIENYMGFQFITGSELMQKFEDHSKKFNADLIDGVEVKHVSPMPNGFLIKTNKIEYEARTVIIASGKSPRKLSIPGEEKFMGKGVAYCATCDAPLFSGMDVAVAGGGNSALDAALQLTKFANKVFIINIGDTLTGNPVMSEKIKAATNAVILNNTKITEVFGTKMAEGIKIEKAGKADSLSVSGVFVEVGYEPSSDFAKGLVLMNEKNEIMINCKSQTSTPGIFAAGDVTDVPDKQIMIAAGDGAKSALSAFRYVSESR